MRFIYIGACCLLLASCSQSRGKDTAKFDAYLEQLMSEPYNPNGGSKY